MSAWAAGSPTPSSGIAYVLYGSASGVVTSSYVTLVGTGEVDGDFGRAMAAGDVDHDGFMDLVVGAPYERGGTGNVYIFRGTVNGVGASPSWTLHGGADAGVDAVSVFGFAVAVADFDGDGYDDIAASAAASTAVYADRVLVFRGSASGPAATASLSIPSPSSGSDNFGQFLTTPLDANADGYSDLVIADGTTTTLAYFFAGSATGLPAAPTESLNGPGSVGWTSVAK